MGVVGKALAFELLCNTRLERTNTLLQWTGGSFTKFSTVMSPSATVVFLEPETPLCSRHKQQSFASLSSCHFTACRLKRKLAVTTLKPFLCMSLSVYDY